MCDQQSLRSACAYAQSDQSLCLSLVYYMTVKLLSKHHLVIISLKGGCTGSSEPTLVKIPHCLKSHVAAHICIVISTVCFTYVTHEHVLLNVNKVVLICKYEPKGVQLGGFVGQFACSRAGADPENIVWGVESWMEEV